MKKLLHSETQTEMLNGILKWLNDHIASFTPPQEDEVISDNPELIQPDIKRKAFTELGVAVRLGQRCAVLKENAEFIKIQDEWVNMLSTQNYFFDLNRRIRLFPHKAIAYATMRSVGIENDPLKYELERVLNSGYLENVERSAWDKLDMKYYMDAAELSNNFPSYDRLLKECSLQNLPSLSLIQNIDLYGLTHLLFHFSDFGLNDMNAVLGYKYEEISAYVSQCIALSLIKQDWDLLAELLINQHCLKNNFDSLDREAANALSIIQQPSGFIPGRAWVQEQHESHNADPAAFDFDDVYHPTLVVLIMLICELTD